MTANFVTAITAIKQRLGNSQAVMNAIRARLGDSKLAEIKQMAPVVYDALTGETST